MPPKVKITKEDIIATAIDLIRNSGPDSINARAIATLLDCSTQPIFSNFSTMEELQKAVTMEAYELYLASIKNEIESGNYPQYKAYGMAYIRFAEKEKELFKLLFMCDRNGEDFIPSMDFEDSVDIIMNANGISKEKATLIHLEMWVCVHGIATMMATSFLYFDWNLISNMISDVYQGIRSRHLLEEN